MHPLTKFTDKLWGQPSLEGVAIIAGQHLMDSTLEIFRLFKRRGLSPRYAFILGKVYSSSTEVFHDLISEGFNVSPDSFKFDSHQAYDKTYGNVVEKFVLQSLRCIDLEKIKKLIIIDDGGYVIKNVIKFFGEKSHVPCVGIEQTSSGYHYIKNLSLTLPIINVARSKAKLSIETPFIAQSLYKRLINFCPNLSHKENNILILGKGSIGVKVGELLDNTNNVSFYDPSINSHSEVIPLIKNADVIIGCSGTTSIEYEYFKYLKRGAILASASSSDREFDAHKFRQLFDKTNIPHLYSKYGDFMGILVHSCRKKCICFYFSIFCFSLCILINKF